VNGEPEATPLTNPATVMLADDHELVRDGIRMVLEAKTGISTRAELVADAIDNSPVER
jgi:DNA-binding NarL/FixJ family response regulator